jgi:methyltransferase family protein
MSLTAVDSVTFVRWANLDFVVTPRTFRPRSSSEGLLDFTAALPLLHAPTVPLALADMCCGSGALGIALFLRQPRSFSSLLLLDSSSEAVVAAESNRLKHGVPGQTRQWWAGDPIDADEPALVLCNPPFMPLEEAQDLPDWERQCIASPDGGRDMLRRCLQSIEGTPHHLVLKSLATQLAAVAECQDTHELSHQQSGGAFDVAYSYWRPRRQGATRGQRTRSARASVEPTFGIELEFFLLDSDGYPAFGSTDRVIRLWLARGWPNPPVPELGSFQIELNPGPWPLSAAGIETALAELGRSVGHLEACAADLGLTVCTTPIVPLVSRAHLGDPALLTHNARSRATSSYFVGRAAVAAFADGDELVFPGETILACLNEIHIHVQLENDETTIKLFNSFNRYGEQIVQPFQYPIALNGKYLAAGCTTMDLFAQADGESSRDGTLRRVGFLDRPVRSLDDYDAALAGFDPIPCPELDPPFLPLDRSVWFWTRLRGETGALRVEFRPMDMGHDWRERVRHLAETARNLASEPLAHAGTASSPQTETVRETANLNDI